VIPLAIFIGIGLIVYVSQHQINWWWYQYFPPKLDPEIKKLYQKTQPFFRNLSEEEQQLFGTRSKLFVEAKEFLGKGIEDVPEDLKYIVAFYAVGVTFQSPVFLFKGYDRIVFYPHPFLSPNYPDHVHSCEVEHEDGTIIYSVEQLMASFFQPEKYYPVGGHPFAEILTANPASNKKIKVCTWKEIESISGFSKDSIDAFIGLEQTNSEVVSIVLNLSGHLS
jgi:hypothetical protein